MAEEMKKIWKPTYNQVSIVAKDHRILWLHWHFRCINKFFKKKSQLESRDYFIECKFERLDRLIQNIYKNLTFFQRVFDKKYYYRRIITGNLLQHLEVKKHDSN